MKPNFKDCSKRSTNVLRFSTMYAKARFHNQLESYDFVSSTANRLKTISST